jgi:hypothetical protein
MTTLRSTTTRGSSGQHVTLIGSVQDERVGVNRWAFIPTAGPPNALHMLVGTKSSRHDTLGRTLEPLK